MFHSPPELSPVSAADGDDPVEFVDDQLLVPQDGDFVDVDDIALVDPQETLRVQFFLQLFQGGIDRIIAHGGIDIHLVIGFFEIVHVVLQDLGQDFLFSVGKDRDVTGFLDFAGSIDLFAGEIITDDLPQIVFQIFVVFIRIDIMRFFIQRAPPMLQLFSKRIIGRVSRREYSNRISYARRIWQ